MTRVLCSPAAGAVRTLGLAHWIARGLHVPPAGRAGAAVGEEEQDPNRPIQFSSSRASPARWTVEHSLGREQQRPWWRVLPFSLSLMLLLGWCFLREETSADHWLRQVLEEDESEPRDGPGPAARGERT